MHEYKKCANPHICIYSSICPRYHIDGTCLLVGQRDAHQLRYLDEMRHDDPVCQHLPYHRRISDSERTCPCILCTLHYYHADFAAYYETTTSTIPSEERQRRLLAWLHRGYPRAKGDFSVEVRKISPKEVLVA